MNIGEMQRKLRLWAEQDKERKFYGLFDLICNMDWVWLAYQYVAQNAGSKTAGCDGVNVWEFDQDAERNLRRLQESLKSGTFEACPLRRVYIPKANGKMRPLGIPRMRAYCTPYQKPWGSMPWWLGRAAGVRAASPAHQLIRCRSLRRPLLPAASSRLA
jgi:hypothetical protein